MQGGTEITIGPGELLDRLSILKLKLDHAQEDGLRLAVEEQVGRLEKAQDKLSKPPALAGLEANLNATNASLWRVEDDLREPGLPDQTFAELARQVPVLNDTRARLKEEIDALFGWSTTETKCYGQS